LYTGFTIVGHFLRLTLSPSRTRKSFESIFIFFLSVVLAAWAASIHFRGGVAATFISSLGDL
jgi:hypothetical protein